MKPTQLSCGCIRGSYLCKEAERLWKLAMNEKYGTKEYRTCRREYDKHFESQKG